MNFRRWRIECVVLLFPLACSLASAQSFLVDQNAKDQGTGSPEAPFKTIAAGLAAAKPGDTIQVKAGEYGEAVVITQSGTEGHPITLQAAVPGESTLLNTLNLEKAAFVKVSGFKLTWPKTGGPTKAKTNFIRITSCHDVEVSDCQVFDAPADKTSWIGYGCSIGGCKRVTMKNCRLNYIYAFGAAFNTCSDCLVDGCDIGPWNFEDGIRFQNCDHITVQNCNIHNHEGVRPGSKQVLEGHVDLIQIIRENHYLTFKNNLLHGSRQGLSGFSDEKWEGKRKGFRIEGNIIYDCTNMYHNLVFYRLEDPVIINNVLPNGYIRLGNIGGKPIVKNNIMGGEGFKTYEEGYDYNLWINGSGKRGAHDLVGADPRFVNAPRYHMVDKKFSAVFAPTKLELGFSTEGKFEKGDVVEYFGDGIAHRVTAVGPTSIEIDPPLAFVDKSHDVWVANWKQNAELKPDYHLRPDSPAIDSADGEAGRGPDREGNQAFDEPSIPNTGAGKIPYGDRGALEYIPERNRVADRPSGPAGTADGR